MSRTSAKDYVGRFFSSYYRENVTNICAPTSISKREFGFILFKEGLMLRHKEFDRSEEMQDFIASTTPSNIYYSAAYYEKPREDMSRKGWLGADLIFDIDSDHIQTPCRLLHRYWICGDCSNVSGVRAEKCSRCGGTKLKEESWLCEKCLEAAKGETLKAMDILTRDLGFSTNDIDVCFSGQRGYHIHIESEKVRSLDQNARKEIVDYVYGIGLNTKILGFPYEEKGYKSMRLDLQGPGWRGRLSQEIYDWILSLTFDELRRIFRKRGTDEEIVRFRDATIRVLTRKEDWPEIKGADINRILEVIEERRKELGSEIDTVVTTDIHRLIRLPTTLHGNTGLLAAKILTNRLEEFDPLKEAVAFKKGTLTVHVEESAQFRLGEVIHGPYRQEKVELPTAAAILLLCKGLAEPVG